VTTYKKLESLKKTAPKHFFCDLADLDEIAAGVNLETHRTLVIDGTYLSDIEAKVLWWFDVWEPLLEESPDVVQCKAAEQLADEVMGRHVRILLERPAAEELARKLAGPALDQFADRITDADLDLLRSYHRFTRFLCGLARKAWPETDLGWLMAEA
jgi:hypothetical protein